ncbi:3-phosphoshikimate 1-carboxyvinyltransferase [Algibacillus agarilyticus]|uniref:3-phosphoshikimate 1-carboxyvinyltransferase n=1 Tax=Algibacillus agarilyticus TaxID=2234133 RepID=UPI000DD0C26F|nr:3-phosphoshikimate 1-carboxyvinyltransferase [Algibacillus agarilyticus]
MEEKQIIHQYVKDDPVIKRLLERMPNEVADRFDEEQLAHIRNAIGAREWGRHALDLRGTVKFYKWRYYYVILAGRNRRDLTDKEKRVARIINACLITGVITLSTLLGLFVLYLIKSALGINLFEGYSLGIWNWFKANILQ